MLMPDLATLLDALVSPALKVLGNLLGVARAYLELRRSREELADPPKARETNRPKHLRE